MSDQNLHSPEEVEETLEPQDHAALLRKLPDDARRIHVRRFGEDGEEETNTWIRMHELRPTDYLVLTKSGIPENMKRRPGRKRKAPLSPVNEEAEHLMELRQEALKKDKLIQVMNEDPSSDEVLNQLLRYQAEIAAALRFEKGEAERLGFGPTQMSTMINRQMSALKAMTDTVLKHREQIRSTGVDLDSQAFHVVFQYTLTTLQEVMRASGCREEMIETVFSKFAHRLENGWMEEAKNRVKKA